MKNEGFKKIYGIFFFHSLFGFQSRTGYIAFGLFFFFENKYGFSSFHTQREIVCCRRLRPNFNESAQKLEAATLILFTPNWDFLFIFEGIFIRFSLILRSFIFQFTFWLFASISIAVSQKRILFIMILKIL